MDNIIVNVPIDILLKKGMNYIKQNKKSIIKIPNLTKQTYNIRPGITCCFETDNAILKDISTLKRTEDIIISNIGQTYTIQASFGLPTAKIKCNYYKLTVNGLTVSGNVLATVDGLAIAIKLVITNNETCWINLEYVKVTEFGKINLETSDLASLNDLISSHLTQWIEKEWQEKIQKQLQNIHKYKYGYNTACTIYPNNPNTINMNVPVDILLKIGMNYIKQNRKSIIEIPNLTEKTYYVGLGITCYYDAYNGTFEDISTLKRMEDIIISDIDNEGQMYTIKAGFRLPTAKLKYNCYKLTVLGFKISGDVLVTMDGLAIAVKLFINNECTHNMYPYTMVQYVQVTCARKINIKITGLGPLNTFISNQIIQKITESQEKIIKKIEDYVKDFITEQLNN